MRFLNLCFTLLLPLALAFTALSGCEKEDGPKYGYPPKIDYNVLPPETQEGLNTFGCKVNGKVWVPRVLPYGITIRNINSLISEKNGTGGGGITCNIVDPSLKIDEWMNIAFSGTSFQTQKQFVKYNDCSVFYRNYTNNNNYASNYNMASDSDFIEITRIDTSKNIISGLFQFSVYLNNSTNPNDKIEITEGRFDLKYSQQ